MWKPLSLRAPLLLSVAAFTAGLIVVLEYLSRVSRRDGGLAFTDGSFSTFITFSYLYLPTLIAVVYSMIWSWVDLDAKRLEPYFQMSKNGGVPARDSLYLHYPFDFVAFAPYRALRRRSVIVREYEDVRAYDYRHWSVVFAGAIMVAIFWALTPLTSAVFSTAAITHFSSGVATTTHALSPMAEQPGALTVGFMMTAYGSLWLDQDLPGYTTKDSALTPFVVNSSDHLLLSNKTWTSTTTMYTTTLACKPAIISTSNLGLSYEYSNGNGCVASAGFNTSSEITAWYIGYYMNQFMDYALSKMGCSSENFSHTFLAFWGETSGNHSKSTALFCEPAYWATKVNATVSAENQTVTDIVTLETPVALPGSIFNTSNFELVIGTGAQMTSRRADIPDTQTGIFQTMRLLQLGIPASTASSNMVGFAVGATQHELSDYTDANVLAASFEAAHKLLFALAMNSLFSASNTTSDPREAIVSGSTSAIVVIRTLALLVESILGLVTVLTFALLSIYWSRPSQLRQDPASLNDIMSMIEPRVYERKSAAEGSQLAKIVQGKFQLCTTDCVDEDNVPAENSGRSSEQASIEPAQRYLDCGSQLVRPWEMRRVVGSMFTTVLLLALVTVVVLQSVSKKEAGLRLPSRSPLINQLVTNYAPVVFATFLEPFWLLLNRLLCILQPFEELSTANAKPSKSFNLKYTSLPPQLVILRALRARHFLLVAVCAIGLSANVMSVALSGLFQTSVNLIAYNGTFTSQYLSIIHQNALDLSSSDPSYVAKANISDGTSLPPWVSRDRYFLPFAVDSHPSLNDTTTTYKALTQGFGVSMNCVPADYNSTAFLISANPPVVVPDQFANGHNLTCSNANPVPAGGQNNSKAALEVLQTLTSTDPSTEDDADEICGTLLLSGFLRANLSVSLDDVKTKYIDQNTRILAINSLSSLWMVCQPTLSTAPYSVTVDRNGRVQEYTQAGPDADDVTQFFSNTNIASLLGQTRRFWVASGDVGPFWHNDVRDLSV